MRKAKRNIGQEILDGLRELKRGEVSRVINVPDVASIREKTGLSQSRFAALLGVSVRTLQDWEQGRRAPSGAARPLVRVADRHPHALLDVAQASTTQRLLWVYCVEKHLNVLRLLRSQVEACRETATA